MNKLIIFLGLIFLTITIATSIKCAMEPPFTSVQKNGFPQNKGLSPHGTTEYEIQYPREQYIPWITLFAIITFILGLIGALK